MSDQDRPGAPRDATGEHTSDDGSGPPDPVNGAATEEPSASGTGDGSSEDGTGEGGDDGGEPPRRRGTGALWLAVLILAGALGAGAYFGMEEIQDLRADLHAAEDGLQADLDAVRGERETDRERIAGLATRLEETAETAEAARAERTRLEERLEERMDELVGERIGAFTERVDELVDERVETFRSELQGLDGRIAELDDRQNELLRTLDDVSERADAQGDQWVRAEAAYLAQVAVHRVRYHGDRDLALAALRNADRLLSELGGEGIPGRSAVRDAIDTLLAWRPTDRAALAERLNTAGEGLEEWPIRARREEPGPVDVPDAAVPEELEGWRNAFARGWNRLKDGLGELIRVHREDDLTPYLPPEHRYFLRENLRLQLETARGALFQGNETQWERSLAQAVEWIEAHFDTSDPDVAEARDTLSELRDTDIVDEPPDIEEPLDALAPLREAR